MNIEKIEINGHYVWVDVDAEIKEGDYFHYKHFGEHIIDKVNDLTDLVNLNNDDNYFNKIIAASPELRLRGVPTYVDWLAEQEYEEARGNGTEYASGAYSGFIKGYQTAEKELPTWDDVRKAIDLATTRKHDDTCIFFSTEEIIEQLKQDKK